MRMISLSKSFRLWAVLLVMLIAGLTAASVALYNQANQLHQLSALQLELNRNSAAFVMLANEQLVYDKRRFNQQLEDASENLKMTLLRSKKLISDYDSDILLVYLADIRFLLKRFQVYNQKFNNQTIRSFAFDGIMSKIYGLDSEVNRIMRKGQTQFDASLNWFMGALTILLLLILVIPMLGLQKLRGTLFRAVESVVASTQKMFDEKLQNPVELTDVVEMNTLVEALNRLRTGLLAETASKEALRKEVGLRVQAESEVRELLEELQTNQAKMLQMEKLSAMGTMVGGVAHELNNPLMGILNYLQYAQKRLSDARTLQVLSRAEQEVTRIQTLVTNMLVFSRTHNEVELQVTVLKETVEQVLMLLEGAMKQKKIEVLVDISPEITVVANSDLLKQIVLNLATNARDAVEGLAAPRIKFIWDDKIKGLCFTDNGTGIPEATQKQIFDPFFTTKPAGKGTGLGLSISKEMAVKMGGDLVLEYSIPGETRFVLQLQKVIP